MMTYDDNDIDAGDDETTMMMMILILSDWVSQLQVEQSLENK